jgi:oxalate decarboxylase/phosphoglucose isomerase-like protein (cupin superfamily)
MPSKLIDPDALPTMTFEWGVIKPLVATDNTDDPAVSLMHVVLLPGQGHERHNHPGSDEILYILAGRGDQMVDDGEPFEVRPGQAVFIPKGAFHSTVNTGWEPMTILAIYAPAGAEQALKGLPDYRETGPGEPPPIARGSAGAEGPPPGA